MVRRKNPPLPPDDFDEDLPDELQESLPSDAQPLGNGDDRLIQQPGVPKPEEADATGEGDVEALAQEIEGRVLAERTEEAQRERPSARRKELPPDIRRRRREGREFRRAV